MEENCRIYHYMIFNVNQILHSTYTVQDPKGGRKRMNLNTDSTGPWYDRHRTARTATNPLLSKSISARFVCGVAVYHIQVDL